MPLLDTAATSAAADATFQRSMGVTFIYAAMTVAGALSFLPGGLGVTEAGMLALLTTFGTGIARGTAAAATFVTRACTLWFAVGIGVGSLAAGWLSNA